MTKRNVFFIVREAISGNFQEDGICGVILGSKSKAYRKLKELAEIQDIIDSIKDHYQESSFRIITMPKAKTISNEKDLTKLKKFCKKRNIDLY